MGETIPERAIETARKFRGIAHEGTFISITCDNEFPLDGQNPSVHHVARSNTICASFGVGKGHISETFD